MNEFILLADTETIVQTHTVCTTKADKTDKTVRFTMALEAEAQCYRHFLNRTFCNSVGLKQNHRVTDVFLTLLFANP